LASGGYIIRISPTAMGMLVVPAWKRLNEDGQAGHEAPQRHSHRHGKKYPQRQKSDR